MDIEDYMKNMKKMHSTILHFVDSEDNIEENYQNLTKIFCDLQIHDKKHEIKAILYIILSISNNHYRSSSFFFKIEQILQIFTNVIRENFTNFDIFSIFEENNRILLYFIENKILVLDEKISISIFNKYGKYFSPEIKRFWQDEYIRQRILLDLPENFYEKRKIGENDNFICNLIRKDLIDEFISHVNHENLPLNSRIKSSIYETNLFLINNKNTTLIEYASFFGSIQIFKYLYLNKVELNSSIWIYAIHGDNPELINFLEECKIEPMDTSFNECLLEAIKCNHNDLAFYIINNLFNEKVFNKNSLDVFQNSNKNAFKQSSVFFRSNSDNRNEKNVFKKSSVFFRSSSVNCIEKNDEFRINNSEKVIESAIENHNYEFFPSDFNRNFILFYLSCNDYFTLIELLLKNKKIDINAKIILLNFFKRIPMKFILNGIHIKCIE